MPSLDLAAIAPALAAAAGAVVALVLRPREARLTPTGSLWALWAGLTGGALAAAGFSGELLGRGTGGVLASLLGSLFATGAVAQALARRDPEEPSASDRGGPARPHPPAQSSDPARATGRRSAAPSARTAAGRRGWRPANIRRWGIVAAAVVIPAAAAAAGLGLPAVLALITVAAAGLAPAGWSMASGFFLAAAMVSAAQVVVGTLLLSPLGLVGQPVPTVVVAALALLPTTVQAVHRRAWVDAARRTGAVDAVAVVVAGAAGLGWWSLFRGLDHHAAASQAFRLGEDHAVHILLLDAVRGSGTTAVTSQGALEHFATYFPGPAIWQAALGSVLPAMTTVELYLISTGVLLALVAGGATAVAGSGSGSRRAGVVAALGALAVGLLGTRVLLAFFEYGFPGQLLTSVWIVAALALLLDQAGRGWAPFWVAANLALSTVAATWTWSLAVPPLAAALAVLAVSALRRRRPGADAVLARVAAVGALVGLVAAVVARHRLVAVLETLNLEGAVFRAIPLWLVFGLVLALPFALRRLRRPTPLAVTALVLSLALGTWTLSLWNIASLGGVGYYPYKLTYLLFVLGWASVGLLVATTVHDREATLTTVRAGVMALVLLLAVAGLAWWPAEGYRGWLAERGVLGADQDLSCALAAASSAASGTTAVAVGYGSPVADYLTTKAMIVGAGHDRVTPFLSPQITEEEPSDWPWPPDLGRVLVVPGPQAAPAQTAAVVSAAEAGGAEVTVAGPCPAGDRY